MEIGGIVIPHTDKWVYLGMLVDKDLTFENHINRIILRRQNKLFC